jgi:hypothetical protein
LGNFAVLVPFFYAALPRRDKRRGQPKTEKFIAKNSGFVGN